MICDKILDTSKKNCYELQRTIHYNLSFVFTYKIIKIWCFHLCFFFNTYEIWTILWELEKVQTKHEEDGY